MFSTMDRINLVNKLSKSSALLTEIIDKKLAQEIDFTDLKYKIEELTHRVANVDLIVDEKTLELIATLDDTMSLLEMLLKSR